MTERFALKTKYFYDEANRQSFREEDTEMSVYGKAIENKPLGGGGGVTTLLMCSGYCSRSAWCEGLLVQYHPGRKSASGSVGGEASTFELRVEPSMALDVLEAVSRFDSVGFNTMAQNWHREQ